jgi:hypothetical protein
MDIGKPQRVIRIEPLRSPAKTPSPRPAPEPKQPQVAPAK